MDIVPWVTNLTPSFNGTHIPPCPVAMATIFNHFCIEKNNPKGCSWFSWWSFQSFMEESKSYFWWHRKAPSPFIKERSNNWVVLHFPNKPWILPVETDKTLTTNIFELWILVQEFFQENRGNQVFWMPHCARSQPFSCWMLRKSVRSQKRGWEAGSEEVNRFGRCLFTKKHENISVF